MNNPKTSRLCMIFAMLVFGTVGIFVRYISLPSSVIAMVRGLAGGLLLLAFLFVTGKRPNGKAIRQNLLLLSLICFLQYLQITGRSVTVTMLLFQAFTQDRRDVSHEGKTPVHHAR